MKVKDCMCHDVTYVTPECSVKQCAKLMCNNHIGCVPVCNAQKQVIGLVTDRDLILRTVGCGKEIENTPVEAEKLMSDNQVRRLPIIENNKIIGILTLGDLAANTNVKTDGVISTLENICGCDKKNAE